MTIDDTNNRWSDTGLPVTHDDVLRYEQKLSVEALDRLAKVEGRHDFSQTTAVQSEKDKWIRPVQLQIEEILDTERAKGKGVTKKEFFKQLNKCDSYKLAEYAISRCLDAAHNGWSKQMLATELGRAAGMLVFEATMNYNAKSRRKLERLDLQASKMSEDGIGRAQRIIEWADKFGFDNTRWKNDVTYLNKHGIPLLLAVEKALPHVIVLRKEKRSGDTHRRWYVCLATEGAETIDNNNELLKQFASYYGPMVCEPRKWGRDSLGPYMTKGKSWSLPLVRNMGEAQAKAVAEGLRNGELNQVVAALNAIQETPYSINEYVFEAIQWIEEHTDENARYANPIAEKVGGFPNLKRLPVPKKMPREEFEKLEQSDQVMMGKKFEKIEKHNLSAKGALEQLERTIGQAEMVKKFEKFWLPHNLDYRGRVYHIPDFGHHRTDFVRALFSFANKTLVTEDEAPYLMLQLANTGGQDKKTLDDRLAWVEENSEQILAAGEDFKSTVDWWGSQDTDSLQFLAACREWYLYTEAKRKGEPFYSGLPIAFDGSCSGLQHYSAAGKSKGEAAKVNLLPAKSRMDKPADFYSLCLQGAVKLLTEDLKKNKAKLEANPINENDRHVLAHHEWLMYKDNIDQYYMVKEGALGDLLEYKVPNPDNPKGKKLKKHWHELDDNQKEMFRDAVKKQLRKKFKQGKVWKKVVLERDIKAAETALALHVKPIYHNGVIVASYGRSEMKRNAMSFSYSSEAYGFGDQLMEDWMDKMSMAVFDGKLSEHPFGEDNGFHAATYLAKIHYKAITNEVASAADGMKFFKDIANCLSSDVDANGVGKHFSFVNQLYFPMHQNYRAKERRKHRCLGLDRETMEYNPDAETSYTYYHKHLNATKSENGIAPNIIHQQDSIHLMMTVLKCLEYGVEDFMMIHDSFATTAGNAKVLAYALREMFVELYEDYNLYEDVLQQAKAQHSDPENTAIMPDVEEAEAECAALLSTLSEIEDKDSAEFADLKAVYDEAHEVLQALYAQMVKWPKPLQPGDLDVKQVMLSDYFFS